MLVPERAIIPEFQVAMPDVIDKDGSQVILLEIEIVIEDACGSVR